LRIAEVAVNRYPLIASFANTVEEDRLPIPPDPKRGNALSSWLLLPENVKM
jgi:hypothetical protein